MGGYSDFEAFSTWLMVGGGILAVFGLAAYMMSKSVGDRGGLSHVLTFVGVALFLLGLFFYSR